MRRALIGRGWLAGVDGLKKLTMHAGLHSTFELGWDICVQRSFPFEVYSLKGGILAQKGENARARERGRVCGRWFKEEANQSVVIAEAITNVCRCVSQKSL